MFLTQATFFLGFVLFHIASLPFELFVMRITPLVVTCLCPQLLGSLRPSAHSLPQLLPSFGWMEGRGGACHSVCAIVTPSIRCMCVFVPASHLQLRDVGTCVYTQRLMLLDIRFTQYSGCDGLHGLDFYSMQPELLAWCWGTGRGCAYHMRNLWHSSPFTVQSQLNHAAFASVWFYRNSLLLTNSHKLFSRRHASES